MTQKSVSLAVHRNTTERRRRKAMRDTLVSEARDMARKNDPVAFAIVTLSSDGSVASSWDTGNTMPLWAWSAFISSVLHHDVVTCNVADDWRPSLDQFRKPEEQP